MCSVKSMWQLAVACGKDGNKNMCSRESVWQLVAACGHDRKVLEMTEKYWRQQQSIGICMERVEGYNNKSNRDGLMTGQIYLRWRLCGMSGAATMIYLRFMGAERAQRR